MEQRLLKRAPGSDPMMVQGRKAEQQREKTNDRLDRLVRLAEQGGQLPWTSANLTGGGALPW